MRIDPDVKRTIESIAHAARMSQTEVVERAIRHASECWKRGIVVELQTRQAASWSKGKP